MTIPTNPQEPFSPFLPTTVNYPKEQDRLPSFLEENLANYADVINDKKIGLYLDQAETFNGNKLFYVTTQNTRNGYQVVFYIQNYPNSGVITFPMIADVNNQLVVTHTWGSASKPPSSLGAGDGSYFSYNNQGDSRVSYTVSDTLITITTTVDLSAYSGFIFFEFLRDGT